jgi:hypothetical protein
MLMLEFLEGDRLGQLQHECRLETIARLVRNHHVLVCEDDFSLEFRLRCF